MIAASVIVVFACVAVCFFAAAHSVLKTFSRKRLADLLEERGRPNRIAVVNDRLAELQLTTGLLRACSGLTVVLATLYLVERRMGQSTTISPWPFVIAFGIAAVLLSVFSVAIPVSWAKYRGERLLVWSLPLLRVVVVLVWPVTSVLRLLDPIVRRISGVDLLDDDEDLSDQVLAAVEDHEEGEQVDDEQKQMIEAVFDLGETDAGAIMTPRTDIQGIELPATLDEVKDAVLQYGHSRVPVYRENLDTVVGILYAKDLINLLDDPDKQVVNNPSEPFDLESLLREPFL
ncbi:MAG: CNNM domain-containing protein, partial [Planctomycetota bacterium]